MFDEPLNSMLDLEKGNMLLSEPFLSDPNFQRVVILLCEHSEEGSFGLVLNRPSNFLVSDVTDMLDSDDILYQGGPVQTDSLHFIHSFAELEDAEPIAKNLYWGGDIEHLQELEAQGLVTPKNCRFFVGYSGWSSGQLATEIAQEAWIISRYNPSRVLAWDAEKAWRKLLRKMGGKYQVFANYPIDPRLN
ncbi:MAG: YqgE/AlgH family protein [Bernardetiaceae bacterium]|nr:YqgE/AlgH family protein [Bernardetiaceae bacterium]